MAARSSLASCWRVPSQMYWVLEGLSRSQFDDIQGTGGQGHCLDGSHGIRCQTVQVGRGGDLGGTGGTVPPKFEVGAHALVSPIFREVVLSDARESTNRVKNGGAIKEQGILF